MTRTRFLWFLLCLCVLPATSARAATIPAASCSQPDVTAAVASAANGDTVTIPAGNCTWTAPVTISKGITLQGAGQLLTVIAASATSATDLLLINGNGAAFRLTGVGFTGNNSFGAIQIDGHFSSLRIDHLQFTNLSARAVIIGYGTWPTTNSAIYGLADHITFSNNACHPFALHNGKDLEAWTNPDNLGSSQAFYLEDSTFTWNVVTQALSDCTVWDQEHGARAVIRHNTITNGTVQGHDTGGTPQARGLRIKEVYSNTFICNQAPSSFDCGFSPIDFRGGSSLIYDNTIPLCVGGCTSAPGGFENANSTELWRVTGTQGTPPGTSHPWNFKCTDVQNPVASDFRSHCSGGSFPACGAFENPGQACSPQTCGGGSCGTCVDNPSQVPAGVTILSRIDGSGPGNYPCRDQVGWGMDSADHTTQTLTPAYWWNNTDPNRANAQLTSLNVSLGETNYIKMDREVYLTNTAFSGTTGVGRGLLSARPSTCVPMVGYFATDTNTLYRCTSPSTWTSYYTPFTYPHPLQSGANPPSPPPGLRVTGVH